MEYFWEIFWGVVFTATGAAIAALFSWIVWAGALIGLVIYLIGLVAVKTGLVEAAVDGFVEGILP